MNKTFVPENFRMNLRSQELSSLGTFISKKKISIELTFPDTDNY